MNEAADDNLSDEEMITKQLQQLGIRYNEFQSEEGEESEEESEGMIRHAMTPTPEIHGAVEPKFESKPESLN